MEEKLYTEADMIALAEKTFKVYRASYIDGHIVGCLQGTIATCAVIGTIVVGCKIGNHLVKEALKKKPKKKAENET